MAADDRRADMSAEQNGKASGEGHNATEDVSLETAVSDYAKWSWGLVLATDPDLPTPEERIEQERRLLSIAIRAGVREGEERRHRIRTAIRENLSTRQLFDWVVAQVCVRERVTYVDVEREIGDMSHTGEVVLWEDGTIEKRDANDAAISHDEAPSVERERWARIRTVVLAACVERRHRDDVHNAVQRGWAWGHGMPLPGLVEVRAIVDHLVASGELRLFAVDWTVQRADAGDAAPTVRERLGDTPEEIEDADRIAEYLLGPREAGEGHDPERWAKHLLSEARECVGGPHLDEFKGSHARGFIRYLDEARAVFVVEAAKLDAAQAKGSWAQPAVSLSSADARAVIRVLAWFLYLCTPQQQPVNPYCREHGIPCPESFGGSDYEPYAPPPCTCEPPRLPEPAQPLADTASESTRVRVVVPGDGAVTRCSRCFGMHPNDWNCPPHPVSNGGRS